MKVTIALVCLLALASTIQAGRVFRKNTILAQEEERPSATCVWLYKHVGYNGGYDEICLGNNIANVDEYFNHYNWYSSIKVGTDVEA